MARILYLITKSELGGAQSHVLDLVAGMVAHHEIHLATSTRGPLTEAAESCGAQIHILPKLARSIHPLRDLGALRECAALVRRVRPDLLHCHSSKAGLIGRVCGRKMRVATIFTAHGWGFAPGTPRFRRALAFAIEWGAARLAQRIICVSESDRQLALRCGVGTRRTLRTIRLGLASTREYSQAAPQNEPMRLLCVARFSEQKDQPTLLRALAAMSWRDVHLDLVGSGPQLASCRALAHSLGVENRVSFLGDRHDVPQLLATTQVFVLATHYEGLPISILEAMRAGLPIVATRVNGVPEEVAHEQSGLLVPRGDVAALAMALDMLAAAPDLRRQMGRAGHRKFHREFSAERMLQETEELYREVLGSGSRGVRKKASRPETVSR